MKKNDVLILSSLAAYAYLFYEQYAGVNFLLFTLLLTGLLLVKEISLLKNKAWLAAASGSVLSATAVLMYGNGLSVIANIISLLLLAAYSFQAGSSLIFAAIRSSFTFISALPYFAFRVSESPQHTKTSNMGIRFLIILVPVIVSLLFLFLYREANPLFKNYTDQFSLDFISWQWIRFVLLGWVLLYAFFNQVDIPFLTKKDQQGKDALAGEHFTEINTVRIGYENLSGIILFTLLNVILLLMNMIDVSSIWISAGLPQGMTHAEFVHQGVGLLIISILIAIAIILFYFRGGLNFYRSNHTIKILAYLWIVQNAILIITTASKNQLYIQEFSLTYKRIGVYVYLLLALIGLATTFIKIFRTRSNWFLFRKNAWLFYGVLILSCFINWDLLITRYNIERHKTQPERSLDKNYLLGLSATALPYLMDLEKNNSGFTDPVMKDTVYRNTLCSKISAFYLEEQNAGWQSWNMEASRVKSSLLRLHDQKKWNYLDLSGTTLKSIAHLGALKRMEYLNLGYTHFTSLQELSLFPELKHLDLSSNKLTSLDSLPGLKHLVSLNISYNPILNLHKLQAYTELTELDIRGLAITDATPLLKLNKLEVLKHNSLPQSQVDALKGRFPRLLCDKGIANEALTTEQPQTETPQNTIQ